MCEALSGGSVPALLFRRVGPTGFAFGAICRLPVDSNIAHFRSMTLAPAESLRDH